MLWILLHQQEDLVEADWILDNIAGLSHCFIGVNGQLQVLVSGRVNEVLEQFSHEGLWRQREQLNTIEAGLLECQIDQAQVGFHIVIDLVWLNFAFELLAESAKNKFNYLNYIAWCKI